MWRQSHSPLRSASLYALYPLLQHPLRRPPRPLCPWQAELLPAYSSRAQAHRHPRCCLRSSLWPLLLAAPRQGRQHAGAERPPRVRGRATSPSPTQAVLVSSLPLSGRQVPERHPARLQAVLVSSLPLSRRQVPERHPARLSLVTTWSYAVRAMDVVSAWSRRRAATLAPYSWHPGALSASKRVQVNMRCGVHSWHASSE